MTIPPFSDIQFNFATVGVELIKIMPDGFGNILPKIKNGFLLDLPKFYSKLEIRHSFILAKYQARCSC